MYVCMFVCEYVCVCNMYIYIHIHREREREKKKSHGHPVDTMKEHMKKYIGKNNENIERLKTYSGKH